MLFMCVYSWEPGQRDEVIKRRLERERANPEGSQVIGEWIVPGGHRGFMLFEAQDITEILGEFMEWSDLMKFDTVPVIEAQEVVKLVKTFK
jgi:hypothetical protein